MKTFEELVEGIKEIKECGFVKTHRVDNTGIGKTLEDLLGIKEKNTQNKFIKERPHDVPGEWFKGPF